MYSDNCDGVCIQIEKRALAPYENLFAHMYTLVIKRHHIHCLHLHFKTFNTLHFYLYALLFM